MKKIESIDDFPRLPHNVVMIFKDNVIHYFHTLDLKEYHDFINECKIMGRTYKAFWVGHIENFNV